LRKQAKKGTGEIQPASDAGYPDVLKTIRTAVNSGFVVGMLDLAVFSSPLFK